ncbi:hypothetical protein GCM10020367_70480 [Streptomyces sannanensis]|uniref:Uncharacterized protein n=1 Tax=Streptomyces sannanensis TaxID=285536 RepID=A0ABP6SMV6_9ACTN
MVHQDATVATAQRYGPTRSRARRAGADRIAERRPRPSDRRLPRADPQAPGADAEWVIPLHEALALPLRLPEQTDPRRYLHIPRNFSEDDA